MNRKVPWVQIPPSPFDNSLVYQGFRSILPVYLALYSRGARSNNLSPRQVRSIYSASPSYTNFYRNKAREAIEGVAYLDLLLLLQSLFSDAEIGLFGRSPAIFKQQQPPVVGRVAIRGYP
ncbi:MAG: hypothetical protein WBA89_01385 [Microcoleus sp.]|uniref:hypothetical protein n=1 Tax=Microcoleus sp. TaxID=44472 RepID=UPI003C76EE4D